MATNEVLESLREGERQKELKEMYENLKVLFGSSSNEALTLDSIIKKKFAAPTCSAQTNVSSEIKFNYATMSFDDLMWEFRRKGVDPVRDIHYKEEDGLYYHNTNRKSYPINDDDAWLRSCIAEWRSKHPSDAKKDEELKTLLLPKLATAKTQAANEVFKWVPLKWIKGNDKLSEDLQVRLLPDKSPNWYRIVRNLKTMGEEKGYAESHFKHCLMRLVTYYNPELTEITEPMEASELATFLSEITLPNSIYESVESSLNELVRKPNRSSVVL